MTVTDILTEWSYRCSDGIVDLKDPIKITILNEILKEIGFQETIEEILLTTTSTEKTLSIETLLENVKHMKLKQYLKEVSAVSIKEGNTYILSDDIGKFKKGEKVEVIYVGPWGNDIELILTNNKGIKDNFYLDRNDDFEALG